MPPLLLLLLTIAALVALVPLIVWGGTSSWRHALYALREYGRILLWGFALVGGLAALMVLGELIG